jgi:hypothetical protein
VVPEGFDPERWVRISRTPDIPGRCFLGGNAHTHYGHIHAWSEDLADFVTIRKDDVVDASPLARSWIDGFLVGSEPDLHEYLGISADEAGYIHREDPAFSRWRTDMAVAREEGWMPFLRLRPSSPVPADAEHLEPWCWVGGEFWAWRNGSWSVVDPEPAMRDGFLASSICESRGRCDLAMFGVWAICMDCGDATETEPDDADESDDRP